MVITIIGILIALLLPAVQAAREAARRAQCSNNMKQLGLAILDFENQNSKFPAGGLASPYTIAHGGWGHSWIVLILPYLEQEDLYLELNLVGNVPSTPSNVYGDTGRVYGTNPQGVAPGNVYNGRLLAGLFPPMLVCPSSPLPNWMLTAGDPPGQAGILAPCYAAIAGAVDNPSTVNMDSNTDANNTVGLVSAGGVLINRRSLLPRDVYDGLSNTILVGEQSDWCVDRLGQQYDGRSNQLHGFPMGPGASPSDLRFFNGTSVRYPINTRTWELMGIGAFNSYGANLPILSADPAAPTD